MDILFFFDRGWAKWIEKLVKFKGYVKALANIFVMDSLELSTIRNDVDHKVVMARHVLS